LEGGLLFLSDRDARPPGAAHPKASLWDNGSDAAEQLVNELEVRRIALRKFGEGNLVEGSPLALLEEVLATVYFRHRYQLEAAVKMIGGLDYSYSVTGDGQSGVEPLPAEDQRRALEVVLSALDIRDLDLPETVLELLPPRPHGYQENRELFEHRSAPAFDALGAAETTADLVVQGLLQPERAARLVDLNRRVSDLPGFDEVLDRLIEPVFGAVAGESSRHSEIRRAVQTVVARGLIALASNNRAAAPVRALAEASLRRVRSEIAVQGTAAHEARLQSEISRFLDRKIIDAAEQGASPAIPPGSPIGVSKHNAATVMEECSLASGLGGVLSGGSR
jgi:hypothetical protein